MTTKRFWVGTGWKMNKTFAEAEAYARILQSCDFSPFSNLNIFIVPPFTVLARVADMVKDTPVMVGAQNVHWENSGAYTGEISAPMVRDTGATIAEIGHSERRALFGETDDTVRMKVNAALAAGLRPLVCLGDTAAERDAGASAEAAVRQLKIAFRDVAPERIGHCIVAYEPVWAIGTGGTPATPDQIDDVHRAVRGALVGRYDDAGRDVPVLYGGSVDLSVARSLVPIASVDGLFVGRAAWTAEGLIRIATTFAEMRASLS